MPKQTSFSALGVGGMLSTESSSNHLADRVCKNPETGHIFSKLKFNKRHLSFQSPAFV